MDPATEGNVVKESFLKIDTVWSEANENIESISIKEEIVSDLEAEGTEDVQKQEISDCKNQLELNEITCDGSHKELPTGSLSIFKKGLKSKSQKLDTEVIDLGSTNSKSSCLHDMKNFQIINRRLRCGECRSLVCPECFKIMFSTLHNHFLGFDTSNCSIYSCKFCSFPFQSVCALQAHVRIHTMETPYVCPDCGLIYSNAYFLILHLINKCYHVYKIVSYKCPSCPNIYFTSETLSKHIQNLHLSCVFRCSSCSLLFNTTAEFKNHVESSHQKQKVQHLNYFRCSLCSDTVIPSIMYEKHINCHRENSESYEVEYRCLCGDVFSLIGAFRAHFQFCGKKGILPSHWGFLRKNLKNQDMCLGENGHQKSDSDDTLRQSSNNLDCLQLGHVKVNKNQKDNDVPPERENAVNCKNNMNLKMEALADTCKTKSSTNSTKQKIIKAQCDFEKCENFTKSPEVVQSEKAKQSQSDMNEYPDKKTCDLDGDSAKVFYDYIPCDHLGYVKAQGPEPVTKETSPEKGEKVEESTHPRNYNVVMELDERTGLMVSKKISSDQADSEDEMACYGNVNEFERENSNIEEGPAVKSPDGKHKSKSGTSFFACPFCSVLFPKNSSTFQQFRLHLEYYHSNAALNITVCRESEPADQIIAESLSNSREIITSKDFKLPGKHAEENKCLKANCEIDEGNEHSEKNTQNVEINLEEKEKQTSNNEDKSKSITVEEIVNADENFGKNDFYWTVKLSIESGDTSGKSGSQARNENIECSKEVKTFKVENNLGGIETSQPRPETFEEKSNDKDSMSPKQALPKKDERKRQKLSEDEGNGDFMENNDKRNKGLADCDDDWENSKDSSWSNGSDVDYVPSRESLSDYLPKTKVGGKSKRESEVWSEFYESLQIAERLKKNRKKRAGFQLEESKNNSTLMEYSTKRVVKKPKRYRESSESECSFENEGNSESEGETNSSVQRQNEGRVTTDDDPNLDREKKQKLMSKLKNIDERLVDYLFELIAKKEKNIELYNKHVGLSGGRHAHTLRTYRKKVLNGIKLRGRPLKSLMPKKNGKLEVPEGGVKEPEVQKVPKKQGEDPERRSRRGRPRKMLETAKLRDRRRSDKEVDFIERHFESSDTGASPSKRKRKLSSKLQYYKKINSTEEKDDFSSGQVITGKTGESGKRFGCAICKEVFQDSSDFREHIVSHRQEDCTYQCMECGECFVVRPSLEKHLHAFHKIRNTEQYIAENECGNVKKEPWEPEKEALKENQCKVCRDQFERAIDLTKHFRIHGMAFLKEFKKDGKIKT